MNVLKQLDKIELSAELEKLEGSFAIIGNSSNLKDYEDGPLIDSFDFSVRFNHAPTEGFEKHVGSKTAVRIISTHCFEFEGNEERKASHIKRFPTWSQSFFEERFNEIILVKGSVPDKSELARKMRENNVVLETPNSLIQIGHQIAQSGPSCGLLGVLLGLKLGINTATFGFDAGIKEYSHYFEEMEKYDQKKHHNFKNERAFYEFLYGCGLLNSY